MQKKLLLVSSLAVSFVTPILAHAAEPSAISGVFRPTWTPAGDLQLTLELAGTEAEDFVPLVGKFLSEIVLDAQMPTFLGEPLALKVNPTDATVVFPTATAKARLGRASVIACVDSWYDTLAVPQKLTLDGIMAANPNVPPSADRDLAASIESFVQARSGNCGVAAPARLNDSLMVDVPRYVALKEAKESLGDLSALDSVLNGTFVIVKDSVDRQVTAAALGAARAWATDVRSFGFTTAKVPTLTSVVSLPTGAAPATGKTRASVVLEVLRVSTSVDVAKTALASGDYRPLRPSLHLAETILDACMDEKRRWDTAACASARVTADFRWLELKSDGVIARYLIPPAKVDAP